MTQSRRSVIPATLSIRILFGLLHFALCSKALALSISPYANLTALGGQYFTGQTHSSGVNADGSFVPTLKISPSLYVFPIFFGSYHETQSVYQFLGENTLIQRQLDLQGVLRGEWKPAERWSIKPRAGYKGEWAKQTQDESLWNGLFKYGRVFGGASVQREWGRGSLEAGTEYSVTTYPNYQSLSSDPRLVSTGLTAGSGRDILNYQSTETSMIYDVLSPDRRTHWNSNLTWIRENFTDQKIITTGDSGIETFINRGRTDDILNLSLQQTFRISQIWLFTSGETLMYYMSNQNAFDATQLLVSPFTPRYYNFGDIQLNPSLTVFLHKSKLALTVAGNLGYRKYWERRTQDGSGNFQSDQIYSLNRGGTLTAKYRFLSHWQLVLTDSALTYSSNTRYEANYPYNYSVYSYLGGFSYEFD